MPKYKNWEVGQKPNLSETLFAHTRFIDLTCEDRFAFRFGFPKLNNLLCRVWEIAAEKAGYDYGTFVSLSVTDYSLPKSMCPFRILEFTYEQPGEIFVVKYVPSPEYSSVPLRRVKLPNDDVFLLTVDDPKEKPKEESEVVIK